MQNAKYCVNTKLLSFCHQQSSNNEFHECMSDFNGQFLWDGCPGPWSMQVKNKVSSPLLWCMNSKLQLPFHFLTHFFFFSFFFSLVQSYKKHYLQEMSLIKYWLIYLTWAIITYFGLWLHTYCMIETYVNQPFLHIFDPSDVVFSLLDWCDQILEDAHECDTIRLIPVLGQSYSLVMRSVL